MSRPAGIVEKKPRRRRLPKASREWFQSQMLEGLPAAMAELKALMTAAEEKTRLGAVKIWLEYAIGTPTQTIQHSGSLELEPIDLNVLAKRPENAPN